MLYYYEAYRFAQTSELRHIALSNLHGVMGANMTDILRILSHSVETVLGFDDTMRAAKVLESINGKRLTYRRTNAA